MARAAKTIRNIILVLGDQLTPTLSSLAAGEPKCDIVVMAEVHEEATYVRHHKKKIAFLFSAMRHFANELRSRGWRVDYRTLHETGAAGSFTSEIEHAVARQKPSRIVVTSPGEWRVLDMMRQWSARFAIPVDILDDDRFICSGAEFATSAADRKQLRMEYFYREMRRKTGLLMDGD
jgi:deoxyribodipyrimidine photolyase-related protein